VETDYTEVAQSSSRPGSVHKADEVFLLPREQAVHRTMVDSDVTYSDGDGSFDELDHLVHIDTDMSSLLQVMDSRLVQNSHRSSTSDDPSGSSLDDTVPAGQTSAAVSENQCCRPDLLCCSDGNVYHEYDPVYVPHYDAAAMARRVDNETSYVRTLQSRHNFSPYEEVRYGVRPLLLTNHPRPRDSHQPAVPPRTSSVTDSSLQNSGSNRMVAEQIDRGPIDAADLHGESSHQTSTVSEVDVADSPYESIVFNPVR